MPDQITLQEKSGAEFVVQRRLVLAASMSAIFMAAVEGTIVATAMPTIVGELGGFRLFSWVFAAYLLTQAVTIPIYGRLADLYGRKGVFFVGAGVFLIGSTLSGFAPSMVMLVAFRALQGLGAGAILPIATTIVGDIYTPAERARIQGYLSSVWGISSVIGPVLGAFLVQQVSWRVVFWINLPIGAVAITLIALFLHQRPEPRQHKIDYLGSILLMIGAGALMLVLVQGENLAPAAIAWLVGFAIVALVALLVHERRADEPMLPLDLWRHRIIAVSNCGGFVIGALIMGVTAFLPTYVQGVLGRTPMVAGFVLTAMSVTWTFASIASGRLMVHTTYRLTAAIGACGLVAGSVLLVLLLPPRGALWASGGALLIGAGMGFCNTTFLVAVQTSVGFGARGAATSSNIFMRNVGQAVGTALFGAVLNFDLFRDLPGGEQAVSRLMDPTLRQAIPPLEIARLSAAVAEALHDVYLIAGLLALLALLLIPCLPKSASPIQSAPPGQTH
ncbi:MAG: MDR family MFS transporter [Xanthobacteraceae bacterium]